MMLAHAFAVLMACPSMAAADASDQSWRLKVDWYKIKQATERCKEVRRSCLAFGEEPITVPEWRRILEGLGPEDVELMRRRYSIAPEVLAALRRGKSEVLRDAVGSMPRGYRPEASKRVEARVAQLRAGFGLGEASTAVGTRSKAPAARPPSRARSLPDLIEPRAPKPPPAPDRPEPVLAAHLAQLRKPLERAVESGSLGLDSIKETLAWAKENPPADAAEKRLRQRAAKLVDLVGMPLGQEGSKEVLSISRGLGMELTPERESRLLQAVASSPRISSWQKFSLWMSR